jgi:hypothetical protein
VRVHYVVLDPHEAASNTLRLLVLKAGHHTQGRRAVNVCSRLD